MIDNLFGQNDTSQMAVEGSLECYCDDETEDCFLVVCKKCHHKQHGECVNLNQWTVPAKYMCPTCLGLEIECVCGVNADYQQALIECTKCHLHQHKRCIGLGIGKNPPNYLCKNCSSSYQGGRNAKIEPIVEFFPTFSDKFVPPSFSDLEIDMPPGKLMNKFKEFNKPISPVVLITQLYTSFRDNFFRCHPFMSYIKTSGRTGPDDYVDDSSTFIHYMFSGAMQMTGLSCAQVTQVIDHDMMLDIYRRATSPAINDSLSDMDRVKESDLVIDFSERAYLEIDDMKIPKMTPSVSGSLSLVAGKNGFPTVITNKDLRNGEMICECYGYVSVLEEVDYKCSVPHFNVYNIRDSLLFLNSQQLPFSPMYLRIRRGFASNCEVRIYEKDSSFRVGIFARELAVIPTLSRRDKKSKQSSGIVITAGSELVLPFDITPVCVRMDSEWRTKRDEKVKINPQDFAPIKPSPCQSCDIDIQFEMQHARAPEKQNETTLQNLFSSETIATFQIEHDRNATSHVPPRDFPTRVAKWPVPGKKSLCTPFQCQFDMKPFTSYQSSAWAEPVPSCDSPQKKKMRAAAFWDPESADDWAAITEEDMEKLG